MLDEGIDVPDAEVGINVAGTKTSSNSYNAWDASSENTVNSDRTFITSFQCQTRTTSPDSTLKNTFKKPNWVRETGEMIGVQPDIDDAGVDTDLLARAEQRGHELWAQDLLEELEIETVQGNVQLEELLNALTFEATTELLTTLDLSGDRVHKNNWQTAMRNLREAETLSIEGLQRVWWLFPLYRERPVGSSNSSKQHRTRSNRMKMTTHHNALTPDETSRTTPTHPLNQMLLNRVPLMIL